VQRAFPEWRTERSRKIHILESVLSLRKKLL